MSPDRAHEENPTVIPYRVASRAAVARAGGIAALVGGALLAGWLITQPLYDDWMWGFQAQYVVQNDPRALDPYAAYGHPGGTVILATIAADLVGVEPGPSAVRAGLFAFGTLLIGLAGALVFALRGSLGWAVLVAIALGANPLYAEATPPTIFATLLFVIFAFALLFALEHPSTRAAAGSGLALGLLIATRIDIGLLALGMALAALILQRPPYRTVLAAIAMTGVVYVLVDPFMWSMPVAHLAGLVDKLVLHYHAFRPEPLALASFGGAAVIAGMGTLWAVISLHPAFAPRPFPRSWILLCLGASVLAGAVVLTSAYQAIRYLIPIMTLWQAILPFMLMAYAARAWAAAPKKARFAALLGATLPGLYAVLHYVLLVSA